MEEKNNKLDKIESKYPIINSKSSNEIELKATIIPVNDEITKSKYKTYSSENNTEQINFEINKSDELYQKPLAQIKQENKKRKLSETKISQESVDKNNIDSNLLNEKQKEDSTLIQKNSKINEMLKTPSPKIEKNLSISSYSNSPSTLSTPSILPLLDIENMSSKFRAEDLRERKLIKSIINEYRKCHCLPIYSFKLPAKENITNILLASQGQKIPNKKKNDENVNSSNERYVTDIQIGLFLGYKSGRELLDKFPMLKKRVATLAEKERLENSPISELIVNCLLTIPDTKKWNKFDKQLKLTDLDIQFLKLDEVMNLVIKPNLFDQLLKDEIEEITQKISKSAGERFKSLQQNAYIESSNKSNSNPYFKNISNKMMLLTIDNDLLSFPRDMPFLNKNNQHKYPKTKYYPTSNSNSYSNSESTTPNNKQDKIDTPYRNGFKKSFIKYHQQLALLNSDSNLNTSDNNVKNKQNQKSTYQKSSDRVINHLPIQINKSKQNNSTSSPLTANTSPIQSSSNNSEYSTKDSNIINNQSHIPIQSFSYNKEIPSKSGTNTTTQENAVNTYIHKIEKINKALPLKAKFKLATKENF